MIADKLRAQAAVVEIRARWPKAASVCALFDNGVEVHFDAFGTTRMALWHYVGDGTATPWACEVMRGRFTAEAEGDTATASAEAGLRALAALIRADADAVEACADTSAAAEPTP